MAKSKLSVKEVAGIIESEGLGYAVKGYLSGDSIDDPVLALIWKTAALAMDAIEQYIEANSASSPGHQ